MTRVVFKSEKALTQAWSEYKNKDETVKSVLSVIENETPTRNPKICPEVEPLIRYGFQLGYAYVQNLLDDLAVIPIENNDPTKKPSTYGTRRKKNAT